MAHLTSPHSSANAPPTEAEVPADRQRWRASYLLTGLFPLSAVYMVVLKWRGALVVDHDATTAVQPAVASTMVAALNMSVELILLLGILGFVGRAGKVPVLRWLALCVAVGACTEGVISVTQQISGTAAFYWLTVLPGYFLLDYVSYTAAFLIARSRGEVRREFSLGIALLAAAICAFIGTGMDMIAEDELGLWVWTRYLPDARIVGQELAFEPIYRFVPLKAPVGFVAWSLMLSTLRYLWLGVTLPTELSALKTPARALLAVMACIAASHLALLTVAPWRFACLAIDGALIAFVVRFIGGRDSELVPRSSVPDR